MSKISDEEIEIKAEELAKRTGISKDEAIKKVRAFYAEEPSKLDEAKKKLGITTDFLEDYARIAEKLDPASREVVARLASSELANINLNTEEEVDFDKIMKKAQRHVMEMKAMEALTRALSPPEQTNNKELAEALKESLKPIAETVEKVKDEIEGKKKEELEKKWEDLLNVVKDVIEGRKEGEEKPSEVLRKYNEIRKEAEQLLKQSGYEVKPAALSKEQLEEILKERDKKILEEISEHPERVKEILESKGYKIVGGPIPYDQVQKMLEEERKKIIEEKLEDQRLEQVGDIIKSTIKEFLGLFKPVVSEWFSGSLEERAKETQTSQEPKEESKEGEEGAS